MRSSDWSSDVCSSDLDSRRAYGGGAGEMQAGSVVIVNVGFGVESRHQHGYRCAMPFARKIILHVPVSDEGLLEGFVEQCLVDGVSLVAVVGPGDRKSTRLNSSH